MGADSAPTLKPSSRSGELDEGTGECGWLFEVGEVSTVLEDHEFGDAGPNYFALYDSAVVAAPLGALAMLPVKSVR